MTYDVIEKLGTAVIQHGPMNNRIYLLKTGSEKPELLIDSLIELAENKSYSKIFAKIPGNMLSFFTAKGFEKEAEVPSFYNGTEKACFLGLFLESTRSTEKNAHELDQILKTALSKSKKTVSDKMKNDFSEKGYTIRRCTQNDASHMSEIYKKVFKTYPFPIHEPEYIKKTMAENIAYFCVEKKGRLVALASSEMDPYNKNVEMTDFATLQEYTGNGFALFLLEHMEKFVKENGFKMSYTIARSLSHGMNITFSKMDYSYAGRLKNNTNISGKIESMNIWYKKI